MSDQKNLREVIESLESMVSDLQSEEFSLEQRTERAEEAMKLYRQFQGFFADRVFDVRSLSFGEMEPTEKPFNWKGLA
jgi:exonuclease VII small subunit